jgi:hypothetical protein
LHLTVTTAQLVYRSGSDLCITQGVASSPLKKIVACKLVSHSLEVEIKYLCRRNLQSQIRIGFITFADFLLSSFAGKQKRAASGIGCRSPPFNLDFQKIQIGEK